MGAFVIAHERLGLLDALAVLDVEGQLRGRAGGGAAATCSVERWWDGRGTEEKGSELEKHPASCATPKRLKVGSGAAAQDGKSTLCPEIAILDGRDSDGTSGKPGNSGKWGDLP